MSRFSLVIFDCDGVLVDSESIGNLVLARALKSAGLDLSANEVDAQFRGLSMTSVVAKVVRERGLALGADFLPAYQEHLFRALRHGVVAIEGVGEAIAALALPICVASSGEPEKMRLTLGLTGLLPAFEGRLFSAVQVAHGKPAPDLFLLAARQMGVPTERCVVVEDSVAGVEAAKAAGMTVYGYAPLAGPIRRELDLLVAAGAKPLRDMRRLPGLLAD